MGLDADEIKELRDALWAVADAYSGAEANVGAGAGAGGGESDDDVNSEMDY